MLDIATAYNRYRFLGNEFLTWIWFTIENDEDAIRQCDPDAQSLDVGNRMVLEHRWANGMETVAIKGDAAGLEEGLLALSKGAQVTEINLIYKSGALQWQFSLKGESLSFSNFLKLQPRNNRKTWKALCWKNSISMKSRLNSSMTSIGGLSSCAFPCNGRRL